MKYTAVIITLVMLPIIVQANKNMILAEKCEKSHIWVEYDESLEKECRPMWDIMTKEIKKTAWIIPTTASSVTNESIEKAPSPTKSVQSVKKIENKIKPIWKTKPTTEKSISKTANGVKNSTIRTPDEIYTQVKHLGYREEPTVSLISTCKESSKDPRHCILVWLTLMYNEAWNQQNSKACVDRNNCFGINSGKKNYSILDEGMENWVQKYNRYWHKADNASFFYSKSWELPPSRYCTSEDSSWSSIGCPHGLSIASDKWSKLYKIIY